MADTTFVNNVTLTDSDWFNDLNRLHYTILGDPANLTALRSTLGVVTPSQITASLGANVALNNTGAYFDGPSIAQGSTGTWLVWGTVTLNDTGGAATFNCRLSDGTTVISSCIARSIGANNRTSASLSGFIASPVGNLRIQVQDVSATTGAIEFNSSGNSKDSTISAIRIA